MLGALHWGERENTRPIEAGSSRTSDTLCAPDRPVKECSSVRVSICTGPPSCSRWLPNVSKIPAGSPSSKQPYQTTTPEAATRACWIVHNHVAQQSASCVLQPCCSSCAAITAPQAARSRSAKELMLSCSSMAAEWSRVFFFLPLAVADSWTSHSLRGDGLFRTKPTEPCSGSASNQHNTLLL